MEVTFTQVFHQCRFTALLYSEITMYLKFELAFVAYLFTCSLQKDFPNHPILKDILPQERELDYGDGQDVPVPRSPLGILGECVLKITGWGLSECSLFTSSS